MIDNPPPTATGDLKQLLEGLQPRRPAEVMGEAATSSLVGSTITATLAICGFLIVGTVVVYAMGGGPTDKAQAKAKSQAVENEPPATSPANTAAAESTSQPAVSDDAARNADDKSDAIEAMGIGETKNADADSKPLESRLDELLDGLE